MEAHLTAPGVDVYGAALLGLPTINIGFTRDVAWSHTVNRQDTEDFYELEVVEDDGQLGYRFDGSTRPFEREVVEIRVATDEGSRVESLEVLRSVHGPVIARHEDKALALRSVGDFVRFGEAFRQWWDMARADGVDAFEQALARQAIAGQNIIYADRHGTVAYYYGAASPRRERGDTRFWAGILPGDDATLVWDQLHAFDEIPKVVNPPSGWVQNANDPPWLSTWPPELDIAEFPAYFGPPGLGFRPQRSIRLLRESGTMSLEEMIQLKHSSRSELADRLLPDLVAAAAEHGGEQARRAADVLSDWDRSTDADSEGALLFETWINQAFRASNGSPFAREWSPEDPLETPSGLWDAAAAVAALEAAAAAVESEHGRLDVAWGEVYRVRSGDVDLPANGGPDQMGIFRAAGFVPGRDGKRMLVGGDSFVAAVEMADPPRAFALLGYGNASQADSPHRTDQLALFATKQLRPVWFGAEEVEAHAIARTEFPR
jgi:acyl-homoserine-lactone acylase